MIKAWRKQRVIKSIRTHMQVLGHPLDDFTDLEIEKGTVRLAELIPNSGFTAEEASKALVNLAGTVLKNRV